MTRDWKSLYAKSEPEPCELENGEAIVYTDTAIEHFSNPKNVGKVDDFDGQGVFGDPACGDSLELTLKINDDEVITDIGFLVYGCAGAISTSSMVTELAKGCTIREALKITDDDVVHGLGGLPEGKKHCSLLGIQALRLAIADAVLMKRLIDEGKVKDKAEYRRLRDEKKIRFEFEQVQGD